MEKVIVCIFSTILFKDEYYHLTINLNEGYFCIWPHRQIGSPFEKRNTLLFNHILMHIIVLSKIAITYEVNVIFRVTY